MRPDRLMAAQAPPQLIVCPDLESYAKVAADCGAGARTIPIVGAPDALFGFPAGTTWTSLAPRLPAREARSAKPDPRRWILTSAEPSCTAVATFLATATGRSLVAAEDGDWEAALDNLVRHHGLASLALVVPGWNARGRPNPEWLRRVLAAVRRRHRFLRDISWGIMTGLNPHALSLLAAKAVLQPEIVASYSAHPSLLFTMDNAADLEVDLPEAAPDERGRLQIIEKKHILGGRAGWLTDRPWSLMYFHGHGRSYCGCAGYLCGARPVDGPSATEAPRCLNGMDCANPHSGTVGPGIPGFPRIDPRRYDTPIMLMACCGSGGWNTEDWEEGQANIAMLALAGFPSVVLTNDHTTIEQPGDYIEMIFAFSRAKDVGTATSIINIRHEKDGGEFPFYVLGDPECPAGSGRWPGWCSQASVLELPAAGPALWRAELAVPPTGIFCKADLPAFTGPILTHLHAPETGVNIRRAYRFANSEFHELWMRVERNGLSSGPVKVVIEQHPPPALPPHLAALSNDIPLFVRSWGSELQTAAEPLLKSAQQIGRVQQIFDKISARPTLFIPAELEQLAENCRHDWLDVQRECVEQALKLSPGGLWPFRLWQHSGYRAAAIEEPCPQCRVGPTLSRTYDSLPAPARRQWECVDCGLIEDRPASGMPAMALRAAVQLRTGQATDLELSIENQITGPPTTFSIAGALILDQRGHGVKTAPAFAFELLPGERRVQTVTVRLEQAPQISHRYYVRAILLINGCWAIATKMMTVSS